MIKRILFYTAMFLGASLITLAQEQPPAVTGLVQGNGESLFFGSPVTHAVADAQALSSSPLNISLNLGTGGYNCGRVSSPLYCYGLPVAIDGRPAGTLWLDTYLTGTNAGSGFIVWYNVANLAEGHVTGVNPIGGASMPSQLTVSFAGDTNDGTGSYTGSMTLNFNYYYSAGGGGRGGAGSGYRYICTGGTISVTVSSFTSSSAIMTTPDMITQLEARVKKLEDERSGSSVASYRISDRSGVGFVSGAGFVRVLVKK